MITNYANNHHNNNIMSKSNASNCSPGFGYSQYRMSRVSFLLLAGGLSGFLTYISLNPGVHRPQNEHSSAASSALLATTETLSSISSHAADYVTTYSTNGSSSHIHQRHHEHNHTSHHHHHHHHHIYFEKPLILPVSMALLKQNIPLETYFTTYATSDDGPTSRLLDGDCSCLNPQSDSHRCCYRSLRRTHKMGSVMTRSLFNEYEPPIRKVWAPETFNYTEGRPATDYRDVLVIRNIFDSIVSGYLFHSEGQECDKTTPDGQTVIKRNGRWYLRHWEHYVKYELDPPANGRTMCRYMADESEDIGMHAYIDFVFNYHYSRGMLSHWGLSQGIPEVGDRTMTVCYEDLMSPERDVATMNRMLDFWYNGSSTSGNHEPYAGIAPGHVNYSGGHSTTHDPMVRERLKEIAKRVDLEYYSGEIAWADSVLPC